MPIPSKQPIYKIQIADPVEPGTTNRPANDLEANIDLILQFITDSLIGEFEFDEDASVGLTFHYTGGKIRLDDGVISVPDGTVALTGNNTNYIQLDPSGPSVVKSTTGFSRGYVPLWSVTTDASNITTYTDYRTVYSGDRAQDVSVDSAKFTATDVLSALEWLADNLVKNTGDHVTGDLTVSGDLSIINMTGMDADFEMVSGRNLAEEKIGVGGNDSNDNEIWIDSNNNTKIDFVNRTLNVWASIEAGVVSANGGFDAKGNKITNVGDPVNPTDGVNKGYVDNLVGDAFTFGGLETKMLFASWPLPPGWALDTTYNDRTVLITTNSNLTGDVGGSWTITGMNQAGEHDHGGQTGTSTRNQWRGTSENTAPAVGIDDHRHSISSDGEHAHTFDGNWRPYHAKFVVGVRNGGAV